MNKRSFTPCAPVIILNFLQRDENLIRYFMVKKVKYLWDPDEDRYKKLRYLTLAQISGYSTIILELINIYLQNSKIIVVTN